MPKKKDDEDEDEEGGEDAPPVEEEPKKPLEISEEEKASIYSIKAKVFVQKKVDDKLTWNERGMGLLSLQKEDDKIKLVVRTENSDRSYLLNIFLFPSLNPLIQTKAIIISCVPNPPIEPKCVVCGKGHPNSKESNHCDNGCFSSEGCKVDQFKGQKPSPVCFLIRVKSDEAAAELAGLINKHKA